MKKLPPKKAKFVELLAEGKSPQEAGRELGLSVTTAWRWSNEPEIKARLSELQQERLKRAHGRLLKATETAIETLERLCHHKSGYVAVQSARAILDLALKLSETLDLQGRIEALERKLEELEASHAKGQASTVGEES